MARSIVAVCRVEGGLYSPDKDESAPIRIYSDGWVEDDLIRVRFQRERLPADMVQHVMDAAAQNRARGLV